MMVRSSLVVAVHPDDETLGCGGTLLKLAAQGTDLYWLLVTAMQEPDYTPAQIAVQKEQVDLARSAFSFKETAWLKYPAARLERLALAPIIENLRSCLSKWRPEWVFVPNRSDVHSDHQIISQALAAVLKPLYMRTLGIRRVLACEVLSETEAAPPLAEAAFLPTVFVDISRTLENKIRIMEGYQTELHPEPYSRSLSAIRALARFRGASVGVAHAEAFMLLREFSLEGEA